MDCRIKSGNDDVKKHSRGACFCVRVLPTAKPRKALSKKGKAERRKAHCPTNVRHKRGVRTVFSSAPRLLDPDDEDGVERIRQLTHDKGRLLASVQARLHHIIENMPIEAELSKT
jgi:hypothetical protein